MLEYLWHNEMVWQNKTGSDFYQVSKRYFPYVAPTNIVYLELQISWTFCIPPMEFEIQDSTVFNF